MNEKERGRASANKYVFEPNRFVPLPQARTKQRMTDSFLRRPANVARAYTGDVSDDDMNLEPLFKRMFEPGLHEDGELPPLQHIPCYQSDHLVYRRS